MLWQLLADDDRKAATDATGCVAELSLLTTSRSRRRRRGILRAIDTFCRHRASGRPPQLQSLLGKVDAAIDQLVRRMMPAASGRVFKVYQDSLTQSSNETGATPLVTEKQNRLRALQQRVGEMQQRLVQLEGQARGKLVAALNQIIKRPDLYSADDFAKVMSGIDADFKRLANELAKLDPGARAEFNRRLVQASFGDGVLSGANEQHRWTPGALRQIVVCLIREGKKEEAQKAARTEHPALHQRHRAELAALAILPQTAPNLCRSL